MPHMIKRKLAYFVQINFKTCVTHSLEKNHIEGNTGQHLHEIIKQFLFCILNKNGF